MLKVNTSKVCRMSSELVATCSFCGITKSGEEAKARFVAGPGAFICRDCVELTVEIFSQQDRQWADKAMGLIRENRKPSGWPFRLTRGKRPAP
jgi:hypothetical protein